MLIFALLQFLAAVLGSRNFDLSRPNIDYQLHSYNDLNEFPQILLKGARRFKFDPHYVSSVKMCRNSSSGCLLLSHDAPIPGVNYFSSDELLSVLMSDSVKQLSNNEKLTVALCFKSAPNKCKSGDEEFSKWLALVDDFMNKSLGLKNVEILLDGDAKPQGCLIGRWPQWNSVWIVGDSPDAAFTSNDVSNDYYRFQVLNNKENASNWQWMAQEDVNYGKFSNSSYAYQLWEPDSQQDFQEYIDIYRGGEIHSPGFDFALNIDMAMFWVYSYSSANDSSQNAADTAPAVNQYLDTQQQLQGRSGRPFVVDLGGNMVFTLTQMVSVDSSALEYYVSLGLTVASSSFSSSELRSLPAEAATSLQSGVTKIVKLEKEVSTSVFSVLLQAADGAFAVVTCKTTEYLAFQCSANRTGQVPVDGVVLDVNLGQAENQFVYFFKTNDGLVSLWQVDDLFTASATEVKPLIQIALPLETVEVSWGRSVAFTLDTFFVFLTQGDKLFSMAADLTGSSHNSENKWTYLGVGRNFDVASNVEESLLMLVTDYGFCFNSHTHNTRSYPMVCSTSPAATQYVLDYSFGLMADWSIALKSSQPINSCHPRIFHGSYDQGSFPSIAFQQRGDGSVGFLELHNGLSKTTAANGSCGEPVHRDGIVVDSFDVESWIENLRRHF